MNELYVTRRAGEKKCVLTGSWLGKEIYPVTTLDPQMMVDYLDLTYPDQVVHWRLLPASILRSGPLTITPGFTIPEFNSAEEAMAWGSRLNWLQIAVVRDVQRGIERAALSENRDLNKKQSLALRSQLLREALQASGQRSEVSGQTTKAAAV